MRVTPNTTMFIFDKHKQKKKWCKNQIKIICFILLGLSTTIIICIESITQILIINKSSIIVETTSTTKKTSSTTSKPSSEYHFLESDSKLMFELQDASARQSPIQHARRLQDPNNNEKSQQTNTTSSTSNHHHHFSFNTFLDIPPRTIHPPMPDEANHDGFTACLILMDDNHYLIEWLAYHYYFLPLRRLFVAIDPKSKTSPVEILSRYQGRIDITIWDDKTIFQNNTNFLNPMKFDKVQQFRKRQNLFYLKCMQQAKQEGRNWVAIIDTDEYIVPNNNALPEYQIQDAYPTVYEMLQSPINRQKIPSLADNTICVTMHRLRIGGAEYNNNTFDFFTKFSTLPKPLDGDSDGSLSLRGIDIQNFITYRFQYAAKRKETPWGKTMIDVSKIDEFDTQVSNTNPHRPQKHVCTLAFQFNNISTFVTNHYTGSLEQFSYRDLLSQTDLRKKRSSNAFYKESRHYTHDTNAMFWLSDFVSLVGETTAKRLLQGVGTIHDLSVV